MPARIGSQPFLREHVGAVGAQDEKRRVRDMRHVEQPERDRQPEAHRGIEAAQEQSQNDCIEEQLK